MKKSYWLAVGLALVIAITLHSRASAARLENGPDQGGGRRAGLISTVVGCMAVEAGTLDRTSATVRLEWEGQVDEAFLVLSAAGSRGGHSIYVNGQRVGGAPARPGGRPCQADYPMGIPIPVEALVNGKNIIALTNDANVDDSWTAAEIYLEIHGNLGLPSPTGPASVLLPLSPSEIGATGAVSDSVVLTSSYDGKPHRVWFQVPDVYTPTVPLPLLIGMHGWNGSGEGVLDYMGDAVNERGWLFAAPNTHGTYYVDGTRAMAWPGVQHDVIDAIEYMMSNYNVDASRIYITGASMGGHATTTVAAKYPDVFAAVVEWAGFTDVADWYVELYDLDDQGYPQEWRLKQMRREIDPSCNPDADPDFEGGCGTPPAQTFEYQRRSAMHMPQSSRLLPLKIWADVEDILVDVHHARDLRDAINVWDPPTPVALVEVEGGCNTTYNHCYSPDFGDVFDFLEGFTLSSRPPLSVTVRTDESKPYYWLNVAQTGGDHWSQVQASYDPAGATVNALILDLQPLTLGFNLGSMPIMGRVVERPGMGLPATTYLINGGGIHQLANYTSGYLTTTLSAMGQYSLSISAIEAELSADPPMALEGETMTSTITAVVQDRLNNPVPGGTMVEFSASEGTFPNARATFTATADMKGQVTTTLTLTPTAGPVEIVASVERITGSTSIEVIHPSIEVLVTPDRSTIYQGQDVRCTYRVTNTGDVTLTGVTLTDNAGPLLEESVTLTSGAAHVCSRTWTLDQTTPITVTGTGQGPLGHIWTSSSSTTVTVDLWGIHLPIVIRGGRTLSAQRFEQPIVRSRASSALGGAVVRDGLLFPGRR